jgi:hypothetical protein
LLYLVSFFFSHEGGFSLIIQMWGKKIPVDISFVQTVFELKWEYEERENMPVWDVVVCVGVGVLPVCYMYIIFFINSGIAEHNRKL